MLVENKPSFYIRTLPSFFIMAIPFGKYTIKSSTGPYLTADGSNVTESCSEGNGVITCSPTCYAESQQFYIIPVAEDCNIYTIQSVAHPGVYLRMNGSGVTRFNGPGSGTVNLQYGVSDLEKFRIIYNGDKYAGMFSFESKVFPFVYLRTDGQKGVVNCQYGARAYEMYTIAAVQPMRL